MPETYYLKNAFAINATGQKVNAIATPATKQEVLKHSINFDFDFHTIQPNYIVYKIVDEAQPGIVQGFVAFKHSRGVLECLNMETNVHNRGKKSLYVFVGKALVALCCKYSLDNAMDGCITFEAKNKLMPFYRRLGAVPIAGLRMAIEEKAAEKLIKKYF